MSLEGGKSRRSDTGKKRREKARENVLREARNRDLTMDEDKKDVKPKMERRNLIGGSNAEWAIDLVENGKNVMMMDLTNITTSTDLSSVMKGGIVPVAGNDEVIAADEARKRRLRQEKYRRDNAEGKARAQSMQRPPDAIDVDMDDDVENASTSNAALLLIGPGQYLKVDNNKSDITQAVSLSGIQTSGVGGAIGVQERNGNVKIKTKDTSKSPNYYDLTEDEVLPVMLRRTNGNWDVKPLYKQSKPAKVATADDDDFDDTNLAGTIIDFK